MTRKTQFIGALVIILLISSCKKIIKSEPEKIQNKKQNTIVNKTDIKSDKLQSETKKCIFYCNEDSVKMRIDKGYIITEVSFESNENIPFGKSLPFTPKKGAKNVLFIHFQPEEFKNDCPSSNLALFIELESLRNDEPIKISENIQFAMFTGGPFYRFETKGKTKGTIQITDVNKGMANVILKLEFGLAEENITSLELDSKLTIIKQKDVN